MTDALAVLGLLALLTSGELNPWVSAAITVGLLVALFLPGRYRQQRFSRWAGVIAPLALLTLQLLRLASGPDPIPIIVEFAAGLQVIRLATRRGAAHDQQVILLALLHLIAGTVLGGGLAYGLSFVGFLVLTPGALVLSHLRREVEGNYRQGARDRTGLPVDVPRILRSRRVIGRSFLLFTCLLSVPVFLFTAVLFLLFPRVGVSLLMVQQVRPTRVVGFSDRVDLGGVGTLRSDPTLALRVHFDDLPAEPPPRLNLYLRGAVFDRYDGRAWSRSPYLGSSPAGDGSLVVLKRLPQPATDRSMRLELQPIDPPVVFLPNEAVALRVTTRKGELPTRAPQIFSGVHGELRYLQSEKRGLSYQVYLQGEQERLPEPLDAEEVEKYLQIPPNLSPQVRELAEKFAGQQRESPHRAARALEAALRSNYQYDLESPSGGAKDPLVDFLFVSKRGHCEFYSTAMVMMLRALDIPARNVTGFVGGTYNRFGEFYAVRQGDAHSWVEAFLPGRGWTRFDPTPPSNAAPQAEVTGVLAFAREAVEAMAQRWSEHVVGYNLERQLGYLQDLRDHWRQLSPGRDASSRTSFSGRRLTFACLGLGVLGAGLWWLGKQRRKDRGRGGPELDPSGFAARPIELYRKLEAALAAQGVARPSARPPLLHAQILVEAGHPTGEEALALTELYLRARFGREALTQAEERDFLARVQALRTLRPSGTGPAGGRAPGPPSTRSPSPPPGAHAA
jgi:transglutaminase-like putative cysteine protease